MKYKWKVDEKPTGRYSSFERRGFPSAEYENGSYAAHMISESGYEPEDIKTGNHKPITLIFEDYSTGKRRRLTATFKTVQEAKLAFEKILIKRPEIQPGNLRPKSVVESGKF